MVVMIPEDSCYRLRLLVLAEELPCVASPPAI